MRTRRAISAVVGTVFLVAVVMGTLSYVSYSLDTIGNFSEQMAVEEVRQLAKQEEAYQIETIKVLTGNKLGGSIKNSGEIPVQITTLYVDEQDVDDVVRKYTVDATIAPRKTVNIGDLVDIDIDPTKGYNMKTVSSRGEVNSFYVNSVSNQNVYMNLIANPTVVPSTFETTLLFTVVNNMSNGNYLYNLTPVMNDTGTNLEESSLGITLTDIGNGATPSSYDALGPGEVAIFTYTYEMTSDTAGDEQIFNVTLANSNLGNEALAFVEIKEVPIAADAGSALTSLGITEADSKLVDVLFFHDDNGLTPNNELPMDGSSPDSAGFVEPPNGNTLEFISTSMTASTTIQLGVFNASLNYFSNVVPLGFPEPTFAFMMDSKDCGASQRICDEIGNIDNDKGMKEEEQDPSFSGDFDDGGGPDGDQYFRFDESNGDEWFQDDGNFDNLEPLQYPDTMAVWVRIPATSESYQPIVHFGHPWEDEMELTVVTGGEIEFQFGTGTYGSDSVDCTSPLEYDNNRWVHVVGVRDAPHDCKLYINGQLVDSDSASYRSVSVDVDFNAIGTSEDDGSPEISADVASYIFWDDAALTAEQVNDLYYTNYGNNGTRLYMTIERTDVDGVALETIVPETKLELPYHSVTINQDDGDPGDWLSLQTHNLTDTGEDSYLKYSQANMTWHSDSAVTFAPTERIKLTLDWKDEMSQTYQSIL